MSKGTIYLFGDSVAKGIVLDSNGRYVPTDRSFGSRAAAKLGLSLVNRARFGATVSRGLRSLRAFLPNPPSGENGISTSEALEPGPKAGLLVFGGNDCDFLWPEIARHPEAEHRPATPLEEFESLYASMIEELRSRDIQPIAMTLPPLVSERYLRWFSRGGLDQGSILAWLGDVDQIFRWHSRYDQAVRKVASRTECPLFDARAGLLETGNYRDYICLDGIHPNERGHALMGSLFVEFVRKIDAGFRLSTFSACAMG